MRRRRQPAFRCAFTLVEILIVVIILGIIATIIIGLFANTTQDASTKALKDNLRNVRSQLQLYQAQHGSYPSLTDFEQQMTLYTDDAGNTSPTRTGKFLYGPYILSVPTLPIGTNKGKTGVTDMTYQDGFGWSYDPVTGDFRANLPATDVDSEGVALNTY